MKIGLGLYRESLTPDNFRFARQAGATHIVAHLTNYFRGRDPSLSAGSEKEDGAIAPPIGSGTTRTSPAW
ncbi:hypothetical protein ACVDG5_033520 [Mesorhizobium sp. ORM6]